MKAVERTGVVDEQGNLFLDEPIPEDAQGNVRVIILDSENPSDLGDDPDDTPVEEIKASLRRALQDAKEGKRIPLSQVWEELK